MQFVAAKKDNTLLQQNLKNANMFKQPIAMRTVVLWSIIAFMGLALLEIASLRYCIRVIMRSML